MPERKVKKRNYEYLVFDADHTLLNYLADERAAFSRLYEELGMERTEALLQESRLSSEETWTAAGLYDVHDPAVQRRYHAVYRSHVEDIFKRIFARFPCPKTDVTPLVAGQKFLKNLETGGNLIKGAEKTLAALSHKTGGAHKICIATNGLSDIQRGRIKPLERYIDGTYISEEVGSIKPLPAYFERIFKGENTRAENCLMIGDSLSSDIAGARAVGMDCCWFNPARAENNTPFAPDYEISDLYELVSLLKK